MLYKANGINALLALSRQYGDNDGTIICNEEYMALLNVTAQ